MPMKCMAHTPHPSERLPASSVPVRSTDGAKLRAW